MSYAINQNKDGSIYFNNSGVNHCYDTDHGIAPKTPNPTWQQIIALNYAEKYSRQNGFRIFNATRGGCLEEFERVNFDRLFC